MRRSRDPIWAESQLLEEVIMSHTVHAQSVVALRSVHGPLNAYVHLTSYISDWSSAITFN